MIGILCALAVLGGSLYRIPRAISELRPVPHSVPTQVNGEIEASPSAGYCEHTFNSKTQFNGSEQAVSSGTDMLIGETNKYKVLQMHKRCHQDTSATKERKENGPRNGGRFCDVGVGWKTAFTLNKLIVPALYSLVRGSP